MTDAITKPIPFTRRPMLAMESGTEDRPDVPAVSDGPKLEAVSERPDTTRPAAPPASIKAPRASTDGPFLLAACLETVCAWEEDAAADAQKGIKPVLQSVAALAFVRARIVRDGGAERYEVIECRAGGRRGSDEKALVAGFWASFEAWEPRLVTFNGRGHLLPVLRFASMRHGLTARLLHEAGDRYNSYGARFSTAFHVDLIDQLSDHRASPYSSLAEVARAVGVPHLGLPPGEGDPRARAEANAASMFLVYLKWQLYVGKMSRAGHDASVESLAAAIAARGDEVGFLGEMFATKLAA